MPFAVGQNRPGLEIELEGDQKVYRPGDVIVGRLNRKFVTACPRAVVTIALHGRSKSVFAESNATSQYQGRFTLINDLRNKQTVHDGPMHIPRGHCESWPFVFTIPTHVEKSGLPLDDEEQKYSFIHFGEDVRLPGSFYDLTTGRQKEARVEYFIQGDIEFNGEAHHGRQTAIAPISVVAFHPGPQIGIQIREKGSVHTVASDSLVPGYGEVKLSKAKRLKKLFSSAPSPDLCFILQTFYPSVLQMKTTKVLPFKLRIVPKWDRTSEILRNAPQTIHLGHIDLELHTLVGIRCREPTMAHDAEWRWMYDFHAFQALPQLGHELEIPFGEDAEPLDIGTILNLKLPSMEERDLAAKTHKCQFVYPEFAVYNVQIRHRLKWKVGIKVGGTWVIANGEAMMRVLPPAAPGAGPPGTVIGEGSSSWVQPPPVYEEPPSFEEVQNEHQRGHRRNEKSRQFTQLLPFSAG